MKRGYFVFLFVSLLISSTLLIAGSISYLFLLRGIGLPSTSHAGNNGVILFTVEGSDTIPPNVSIVFPSNTTYLEQQTELNYTIFENNVFSSCWYTLDQGLTNVSVLCGVNVSGISSLEGGNKWIIYANDTFGNNDSDSVDFIVSTISEPSPTSGGGGRESEQEVVDSFEIDTDEINVIAGIGEPKRKEIKITNTGESNLVIEILLLDIDEIVTVSNDSISLAVGEAFDLEVIIEASKADLYAGKILLKSKGITKEVFVLGNIHSIRNLIDIDLALSRWDKVITRGQTISPIISLSKIGEIDGIKAKVRYFIRDFSGNTLFSFEEELLINRDLDFSKNLPVDDLESGNYVVAIEINYENGFVVDSERFVVRESTFNRKIAISMILALLAILVLILAIITYRRQFKPKKKRRRRIKN